MKLCVMIDGRMGYFERLIYVCLLIFMVVFMILIFVVFFYSFVREYNRMQFKVNNEFWENVIICSLDDCIVKNFELRDNYIFIYKVFFSLLLLLFLLFFK